MAATAPLKKSPYVKEWMVQADPPKEANAVKKMNGRSLLLYSNKMTLYFKEWMTASGALKKNILSLQKFDVSNRSSSQKLFPKSTVLRKEN